MTTWNTIRGKTTVPAFTPGLDFQIKLLTSDARKKLAA